MKVDCIIKVGGSLKRICPFEMLGKELNQIRKTKRILLLPGGSVFADLIRDVDRRHKLPQPLPHWMAILAMEQYGFFLSSKIRNSVPVRTGREIVRAHRNGKIPIFLPFDFLFRKDPVPHSWEFTSDSISAYFAREFRIPWMVLLKAVDGVFAKNKAGIKRTVLLPEVERRELEKTDCVDRYFSDTLCGIRECWIINGKKPERLKELLIKGNTIGTRIVP